MPVVICIARFGVWPFGMWALHQSVRVVMARSWQTAWQDLCSTLVPPSCASSAWAYVRLGAVQRCGRRRRLVAVCACVCGRAVGQAPGGMDAVRHRDVHNSACKRNPCLVQRTTEYIRGAATLLLWLYGAASAVCGGSPLVLSHPPTRRLPITAGTYNAMYNATQPAAGHHDMQPGRQKAAAARTAMVINQSRRVVLGLLKRRGVLQSWLARQSKQGVVPCAPGNTPTRPPAHALLLHALTPAAQHTVGCAARAKPRTHALTRVRSRLPQYTKRKYATAAAHVTCRKCYPRQEA